MTIRAVLFCALAVAAVLLPALAARAAPVPTAPGHLPKLAVYLAKGPANSCGQGCDRWIAMEGAIDAEAASRVERFFRDAKDTQRPVYFHSPGGLVHQALAIGRLLRGRKMIARVGQTIVDACPGTQTDDACMMIKTVRDEVQATIATRNAICGSSCTYLLFGATTREVAPDAMLGVHDAKAFVEFRINVSERQREEALSRTHAKYDHDAAAFIEAMGISRELLDLAGTVSFESAHILTRQELYRFRIDTRTFAETAWTLEKAAQPYIRKLAVVKNGDDFRKLEWRLYCEAKIRARLMFMDEFDKAVTGRAVAMMGGLERPPNLMKVPVRIGSYEIWNAVFGLEEVKNFFSVPALEVAERTLMPDGKATEAIFKIDTLGLEAAWTRLSAACATTAASAPRKTVWPDPPTLPKP
jgi:hypothetical protein